MYTADELKPKRYPENKPEQDGEYWCHVGTDHIHAIEHDSWEVMRWGWDEYNKKNDWNGYRILIDYFIPYRLDEPDELETQGYDVIKRIDKPSIKGRVLWHDEHIEITDLDGFDDTFMIASVTNPERYVFVTDKQLKQCHKAVKERKPEIKACPNPECREKCNMDDEGYEEENEYYLHCEICGYCSPIAYNPEEAIRLHNLISGK